MAILGSEFALIARVTVPNTISADQFAQRVKAVFPEFLVNGRSLPPQHHTVSPGPVRIRSITLEGPDGPGIAHSLSEILLRHKCSVRDLDTDSFSAAFAGFKIFSLQCVVAIPGDAELELLYKDLESFEEKFGLQVTVADPNEAPTRSSGSADDEELEFAGSGELGSAEEWIDEEAEAEAIEALKQREKERESRPKPKAQDRPNNQNKHKKKK